MKQSAPFFIIVLLLLVGCQPTTAVPTLVPIAQIPVALNTAVATTEPPPTPNMPMPDTPTPLPTTTAVPPTTTFPPTYTPLPTETGIPTNVPTVTRTLVPIPTTQITTTLRCEDRMPDGDLFIIVTKTYGISREYEPPDLIDINDLFPYEVTLGYPTSIRELMREPLQNMVNDMIASGLQPQILSGYRSYVAQSIAFDKWLKEYPDRAAILSAPPGHSEHQLGLTVDFGSPELPDIVGDPYIQFHTYFYMTSESIWLAENAHRYGFTLSYPREAFELTGFVYEPWHYRYVGVEMATRLKESGITLTELQLSTQPPPCIPVGS
ncbi:MAG: M15 family metallopeptidase [Anaerolineales bacterium]|nr:M15 family metallopeptidase [Anaerolineales bacterium]